MSREDKEFEPHRAHHQDQKARAAQATSEPTFGSYGDTSRLSNAIDGCIERVIGGCIVYGGILLVIVAAWQDPSNQGKVCLAMVFGPVLIYFAFKVRQGIKRTVGTQ